MCGIAGMLRFDHGVVHEIEVERMLNRMTHRGHDHQRIVAIHPSLQLGHRRLAIIDLHANAHQPMFDAQRRLCITFNGEIYNARELQQELRQHQYQFHTQSDTEVILAAYDFWGASCVHHFNGMFAFALWDAQKQTLFCARDPFGIKPFYYDMSATHFAFASESQALAHLHHDALAPAAVHAYLLTMYVPGEASIFANIKKLLPAHTLTVTCDGKWTLKRYWQITQFATLDDGDEDDEASVASARDALKTELKNAVKRQLRSDVAVGGFLSGGIDSGLITALAAEQTQRYHTYSIGYEGLSADENELPHAKAIAQRFATKHTEIYVSASDAMHYLNGALEHLSEPIADPALVGTFVLAKAAAEDHVKVVLNGTGGDEVFAGYTRYTGARSSKRRLWMALPFWAKQLCAHLPLPFPTQLRLKNILFDMIMSTGGSYGLLQHIMSDQKKLKAYLQQLVSELRLQSAQNSKIDLLYQCMLADLGSYLPHELLLLLDQMTMAHTLEGRVPLLDIHVVTRAFQFKSQTHIAFQQTKALLKQIALPYLGRAAVMRKKQGFAGSRYWWVKQNFAEFYAGIENVKSIPGFEHLNVIPYQQQSQLNEARANDIFMLYCFNRWYEACVRSIQRNHVSFEFKLNQPTLVSVIIPTRNRWLLLRRAVQSVLQQTHQQFEIIIVDDGSTIGIEEIARIYPELQDTRVRFLRNEIGCGGGVSRNRGIAIARGQWIAFLDDDDRFKAQKIELQLKTLARHPHAIACSSYFTVHYPCKIKREIKIPTPITSASLLKNNCLGGTSVCMVNADVIKQIGGFNPRLRSAQDWALWLALHARGEIVVVNESLVDYEIHFNERISNNMDAKYQGARHFYYLHRGQMSADTQKHHVQFICFIKSRMREVSLLRRFYYLRLAMRHNSLKNQLRYLASSLPRIFMMRLYVNNSKVKP